MHCHVVHGLLQDICFHEVPGDGLLGGIHRGCISQQFCPEEAMGTTSYYCDNSTDRCISCGNGEITQLEVEEPIKPRAQCHNPRNQRF